MKLRYALALTVLMLLIIAGCESSTSSICIINGTIHNGTICETGPEGFGEEHEEAEEGFEVESEDVSSEEVGFEEEVEVPMETEEDAPMEEEVEEVEEPVVSQPTTGIPRRAYVEGELIQVDVDAFDPDGDDLTITYPSPLDADGRWQTERGDAGEHLITVTVSDGKSEVQKSILLEIRPLNNPPVLSGIPHVINAKEGELLNIPVTGVTDPDDDNITILAHGDFTTTRKQLGYDDAGEYMITVSAYDGIDNVTQDVKIIVENVNRAPTIVADDSVTVTEGEEVRVTSAINDPDGDSVTVLFGDPLRDPGIWQTRKGDAGDYEATITATDGADSSEHTVAITVVSSNTPPQLVVASEITVTEGEEVVIDAEATDADGDDVTISYSGFMTTSTYTTDYDDAGIHTVTVTATDGEDDTEKDVTVVVQDNNRPPVFTFK